MKLRKYHINLYIIVPIIFSCMALLTLVLTYRITAYTLDSGLPPVDYLTIFGAIIFCFTYAAGLLISRIILNPIEKFVERAEQHPAVKASEAEPAARGDQLMRFSTVFNQITNLLSKVDARELFPDIIGQSDAIRGVLTQILKVAPTDSTVLVTGESGTGKEVVANAVVRHSKRADRPFVAVNCAAIPPGLLESELFGHEKGAFTGAISTKKGKFELADTGTLFLDEIGDMPLETQAKILRALELGVCERVGGTRTVKFDVRLIAATNQVFDDLIEHGKFREDLFHRLNVFPISIPPLRDRREDIAPLANHFLAQFGENLMLSPDALQLLLVSSWTGNVRELKNVMERAAVLAEDGAVLPRHLTGLSMGSSGVETCELPEGIILDEHLAQIEKTMIMAALSKSNGVQVKAAELLGVKVRSLWHRIKKYDIDPSTMKGR